MIQDSLLRHVPLFAGLPPAELTRLSNTLRFVRYPAGSVLFYEGEPGDRFYIVLSGRVAVIKSLGTEDEWLMGGREPGEFVGEMSLLDTGGLRSASVRVIDDAELIELTRADFDQLLRRNPIMAFELLRVMSQRLRESNDSTVHDLREKNTRLAAAYSELQAAQAQIIAQETLLRELELAREIQESMLPRSLPHLPDFSISARMLPAKMVGGDFYDVYVLDDEHIGIAIGDVSGKGVPAALFMALASSLLRAEAGRSTSPEFVLRQLNQHLIARNPKHMFVTVVYGVLHRSSRRLEYVRAGHEYPLVWLHDGSKLELPRGRSHPLGLFEYSLIEVQSVVLPPGATLLLYTDGVTEAFNEQGELFGYEQLEAVTLRHTANRERALCDEIIAAVAEHQGGATQSDDITLLALCALG